MNEIKDNVKKWLYAIEKFERKDYESWFKFSMLWFSFNNHYSERYSHIRGEWNQILEFSKDNSKLYDELVKNALKDTVKEFSDTKKFGRKDVKDMRIDSIKKAPFGDENKSAEDFFKVLYKIRCNFFHGKKLPYNDEDNKLIKWAYKHLRIFCEAFLDE